MKRNERLPDFLIVGAMKAGTTTLSHYLNYIEGIYMPSNELHYFDRDENFEQGNSWYSRKLMKDLRDGGKYNSILAGEKTPTYSYQSGCAERIKLTIPDVKLIWIFRDPVKRTFSNFLHAKKQGRELLDFRSSIMQENERIKSNIFHGYVERSKYVIQVERFLKYFNIDQMHFMLFENLIQSPQPEINKVLEFLGISHIGDDLPQHHSNRTAMPLSPYSLNIVGNLTGYDSVLYKIVRRINYIFPRKKPVNPKDLINKLESIFEPYNKRLSDITGLDLESWQPEIH